MFLKVNLIAILWIVKFSEALALVRPSCEHNYTCYREVPNSYCPSLTKSEHFGPYCTCEPGYFHTWDKLRCVRPSVLIGDTCDDRQECLPYSKVQSTVCLPGGKICDCPSDYTHSNDLTDCLKIVNSIDSEECVEDAQCQLGRPGILSTCTRKNNATESLVCRCIEQAVDDSSTGVCLRKARVVGRTCKIQAQCTSTLKYSRCLEGVCQCNPGYVENEHRTRCVKE